MRLYYTGVNKNSQSQTNAFQSLGGHISATLVDSGRLNNIFDSITPNKKVEIRGLGLFNDKSVEIPFLDIYIDAQFQIETNVEIAIVALNQNSCGFYMERISSDQLLPYAGVFNSVVGIDNTITLQNVQPNSYYGVWIKRTVSGESLSCDDMYEAYVNKQELKEEEFSINFIERS